MKKKINFLNILGFILIALLVGSSAYLIYNIFILEGIETFLRYCVMAILIIIALLFVLFLIRFMSKRKKVGIIVLLSVGAIYSALLLIVGINVGTIYSKLSNVTSNSNLYSASIVTLKSNNIDNIKDISSSDKIGIINDTTSKDGYTIPMEILGKNNMKNDLEEYESFVSLLLALMNEEIKYVFVPTNYKLMFKEVEDLDKLDENTKIIYSLEKKFKKEDVSTLNISREPFSVLIMGVDSEEENVSGASFNGDALMLLTFNPNTLKATLLSVPRDTYVPISCFPGSRKNKITHAAWYGEECMAKTIENFTGIKINYTVKINFKGVVKLVDELGGVTVDVPYSFCEQNSNREFGNSMIYVEKGMQTLNGEQALALARNRKSNSEYCDSKWTEGTRNDFVRGENQQKIIMALLDKAKGIRDINVLYKLLDTISLNMETNMSTNEILSLYNVGKAVLQKSKTENIENIVAFQKLGISGYDAYIYDYSQIQNAGTKLNLYNFVPYKGSLEDIGNAMKVNLGLSEATTVKEFSFDVNNPYQEQIIGKGDYSESRIPLLPDFTGDDVSVATSYGNSNGITISISYKEVTSGYSNGEIIDQSIPSGADVDYITSLTVTVAKVVNNTPDPEETPDETTDPEEDEDLEN